MKLIIVLTIVLCCFVSVFAAYIHPKETNATLYNNKRCGPAHDPGSSRTYPTRIGPHCGQGAGAGQGQGGGQEDGKVTKGDQNINLTN